MHLMENIYQNGDGHQRRISNHREPPQDLLVFLHLQVLQNLKTHQKAGNGATQMRRIAYVLVQIEHVPIVNRCADIGTGYY